MLVKVKAATAMAAGIMATGAIAATPIASAGTAPVSTIYSAAQKTCLDVSTTNPGSYFLDT